VTLLVDLYQRPALARDISEAGAMPAPREPSVRHLLKGPDDTKALCGYKRTQYDLVGYLDSFAVTCSACERAR
jgi:hypothetical protein